VFFYYESSNSFLNCRGIELIITEQVKKIRKTLENISVIDNVENSTNERLQQIRKSMGKGKKKRFVGKSFIQEIE